MRLVYFTAGTTGAGHLVRALAVELALRRRGLAHSLTVLAPPSPYPALVERLRLEHVDARPLVVDPRAILDREHVAESELATTLATLRPDLVLVDLFWAPIQRILEASAIPAWLLVRAAPRQWLVGPPELPFARSVFPRVLAIEPTPFEADVEPLGGPLVIAHRDDARSPRLRERLGVTASAFLTLVVHAGDRGEIDAITRYAPKPPADRESVVRSLDLHTADALFPVAAQLPFADALVGAAGYNFAWECHELGLLDRTTFAPRRRAIDDQAYRARLVRDVPRGSHGGDALAALLARG